MANKTLSARAVSAFCENMAMLVGAGIQVDEALSLMEEDGEDTAYHELASLACAQVHEGVSFAQAIEKTELLPEYAARMIAVGENAGTLEKVLKNLAVYYDDLALLKNKLQSAVIYPTVLLGLMALVLGVLVARVLPVFTSVYESIAGDIAASSYAYVNFAYVVAWLALIVIAVLAVGLVACVIAAQTPGGAAWLGRLAQRFPLTKAASLRTAEQQFTAVLTIYASSGMDVDSAFENACAMLTHVELKKRAEQCLALMQQGQGLGQAMNETHLFETLYTRMLQNGVRSGSYEEALARLTHIFKEDGELRVNRLIDSIEPTLAAFLTVAVGVTLLSVMLPIIGILNSVG